MSQALMQKRNPEQIALASADLQPRYEPNFAWKGICGLYQSLPALRAFYPCSSQINTTQGHYLPDIATNFHCIGVSTPQWGYDDLIPYVEFDGEDDAFYYADNAQFDITGTEANVVAAQRGLTLGCWFKTDSIAAGTNGLIGKWIGLQQSYFLEQNADDLFFLTSSDGTWGTVQSAHVAGAIGTSQWHLGIGRMAPNTPLSAFLDNVESVSASAGMASIFNGTAYLDIGASLNHTGDWYDGKISMAFICAAALSDSIIEAIWQQTRAMYGR